MSGILNKYLVERVNKYLLGNGIFSHVSQLYLSILLTRGTVIVAVDVKHTGKMIVTQSQTHFRRYRQYHVRLFYIWLHFFPINAVLAVNPCVLKTNTCANLPERLSVC